MPLPRRTVAVSLMGLLLAACAGPDPLPSTDPVPSATPPAEATPTMTASPPAPSEVPTATPEPTPVPIADDPPPLALEAVVGGLRSPVGIATGPDGWLLVQEQLGRVVGVDTATGDTAVVLDITDRVLGGGERGLLGLALHPDFPDTRRAFVHYSDRNGDTVLSEFGVSDIDAPIAIDPASERVLLQVAQPFANHNGGQLAFGPDGYLWFGLGDGGSGGDPLGNGQNPSALLGKVLRLDVDTVPDDGNDAIGYGIPSDNPFADGTSGAPEVYLYGLRNPWRFSFDRATDELWVADVGQNAFEEVSRLDPAKAAGANLGWNVMEASHCFATAGCASEGLVLPVVEYGRDGGCAVSGGHVYRGTAVEGLTGWYLFADYCSGLVFGIRSDVAQPGPGETAPGPARLLLETGANIPSFGEDADGELYLADIASGTIYRIVAAP